MIGMPMKYVGGGWKTLATSASNKTFGQQLIDLKTTWDNISASDKETKQYRILRGGRYAYYHSRDVYNEFTLIRVHYSSTSSASSTTIATFDFSAGSYSALTAKNAGNSITDETDTNDSSILELQVYD